MQPSAPTFHLLADGELGCWRAHHRILTVRSTHLIGPLFQAAGALQALADKQADARAEHDAGAHSQGATGGGIRVSAMISSALAPLNRGYLTGD